MPWTFSPQLNTIIGQLWTDVQSVMGTYRVNSGSRDDIRDDAGWRAAHWDSSLHGGQIRGADVEMVSSDEDWAGPVTDFRLCWHTCEITIWRQVYDKQTGGIPGSNGCLSHGEFISEVEAVRQALRIDPQLAGLAQQCECPNAVYSRETKIKVRCHKAVIRFKFLERVIQTWVAPPPPP